MIPIDRLHETFSKRGVDFAPALEAHYRNGFVFSTPSYFIMGRPVRTAYGARYVRDWDFVFPAVDYDAWWIAGFAGDMAGAWDILPWELPFIGFERFDSSLRFVPIDTVRRLTVSSVNNDATAKSA